MINWRDHLKPEDANRLSELNVQAKNASKERRRIFDRTRKRAERAAKKGNPS